MLKSKTVSRKTNFSVDGRVAIISKILTLKNRGQMQHGHTESTVLEWSRAEA